MIRAEVRFKNSAFMKALERSRYSSIAEFSRVSGISYSYLVEYANLRHSFTNIEDQVKIAQLLNCEPYELFEQYEKVVEKNKGSARKIIREIPADKMLSFESKEVKMLESDYSTNDIDDKIGLEKEVTDALDTLKDRERDVIKMHFGIGVDRPMSIEEIGKEFGLSRERTRQIKEKAIRRLRWRSRAEKLSPYAVISPSAKREAREKNSRCRNNSNYEPRRTYDYSQKYSRELSAEYRKEKQKKE